MLDSKRLQWLADRAEIEDLIVRINFAIDDRDFGAMAEAFLDGSAVLVGGQPVAGREVLAESAREAVADIDGLQHAPMAILIEQVDADHARVRTQALTTQFVREPETRLTVGLRFRYDAVRTPDGWRLASFDVERVWHDGDLHGRAAAQSQRRS